MEPEMFLPSTIIGHVTWYCYHVVSSPDENNNIKKVYTPRWRVDPFFRNRFRVQHSKQEVSKLISLAEIAKHLDVFSPDNNVLFSFL